MNDLIKVFIALICVSGIGWALSIMSTRKHPSYHENNNDRTLIIYVWNLDRGYSCYREFAYIRRKNGKYRRKHTFYDCFWYFFDCVWLTVILWVIGLNRKSIGGDSGETLPVCILLLLGVAIMLTTLHTSEIIAGIYFRKNVKNRIR